MDVILSELDWKDSRREATLKSLNVEARFKGRKNWQAVGHWRIGQYTDNQLGKVWRILIVLACSFRTFVNLRYACGASSNPPPRRYTSFSFSHFKSPVFYGYISFLCKILEFASMSSILTFIFSKNGWYLAGVFVCVKIKLLTNTS